MTERRFPVRSCAICGGVRHAPIYRQRFETPSGGHLLDGYAVVACEHCGFCFADDVPDQAAFDRYYREASKYEHADRSGRETDHDLARFREVAASIRAYVPSPASRILEVGCATGGLLAALRDAGYPAVAGIDPSPACAEAVRRLYGIPATAGTLHDLGVPDGSSDVLVLVGVLEHVRDLDGALERLSRAVSPGGRIFIAVPDASRYTQGQDAPFQEFSVEHINFFGPTSLANLMARHGFRELGHKQGMVEFSYRTTTPVLHAGFERAGGPAPRHDAVTPRELAAYVEQSAAMDRRSHTRIDALVDAGKPLVVWGTGAHTLRLLASSRLGEANVVAYIDSNPHCQGQSLRSIPILPPAELTRYPEPPILISSRVFQAEIAAKVRDELRLPNEVITLYDLG